MDENKDSVLLAGSKTKKKKLTIFLRFSSCGSLALIKYRYPDPSPIPQGWSFCFSISIQDLMSFLFLFISYLILSVLPGLKGLFNSESHFQDSHYTLLLVIPLFLMRSMALLYFSLWGSQAVLCKTNDLLLLLRDLIFLED